MVQKDDVEFDGITNADEGLQVSFFVKSGSTVLKGDTLANAVKVRQKLLSQTFP